MPPVGTPVQGVRGELDRCGRAGVGTEGARHRVPFRGDDQDLCGVRGSHSGSVRAGGPVPPGEDRGRVPVRACRSLPISACAG